jgi:protein translocase SecG subunit
MAILATWYLPVLAVLLILACILLILVVLIQRGRGGGLAGAFGGVGGHSVLGARTGDFLTWVTIAFAALFILLSVALDRLTPPKPELQEANAPKEEAVAPGLTLAAEPASVPRGKDVTLRFNAPSEDPSNMETVEFYLDTNKDGAGDELLGKDNFASDGWSLSVGTKDWTPGANDVVARVSRFNGTKSGWATTTVTIEPALPLPPPTPPTGPATTAPAPAPPTPPVPEPTTPTPTEPAPATPTAPASEPAPAPAPSPAPAPTPEG